MKPSYPVQWGGKRKVLPNYHLRRDFHGLEGKLMTEFRFEIIKAEPLKGQKLAGSKDYLTHVTVIRDGKTIMDENIRVRKNPAGIFPEQDVIRKKITAPSLQKELNEKLKAYIKKQK
jgi:hypothetical protein